MPGSCPPEIYVQRRIAVVDDGWYRGRFNDLEIEKQIEALDNCSYSGGLRLAAQDVVNAPTSGDVGEFLYHPASGSTFRLSLVLNGLAEPVHYDPTSALVKHIDDSVVAKRFCSVQAVFRNADDDNSEVVSAPIVEHEVQRFLHQRKSHKILTYDVLGTRMFTPCGRPRLLLLDIKEQKYKFDEQFYAKPSARHLAAALKEEFYKGASFDLKQAQAILSGKFAGIKVPTLRRAIQRVAEQMSRSDCVTYVMQEGRTPPPTTKKVNQSMQPTAPVMPPYTSESPNVGSNFGRALEKIRRSNK